MKECNKINTWRQGQFLDMHQYDKMDDAWKDEQREREKLLVRPGPTDNAICQATNPDAAIWIASRLNLAAKLEQQRPIRSLK